MRFAAPSIVRQAITKAILHTIRVGADPNEVAKQAWLYTFQEYPHFATEELADDVLDWFEANGPYTGNAPTIQRRLILDLWKDEKFT